jgi:hypothetical protein
MMENEKNTAFQLRAPDFRRLADTFQHLFVA